jgi:hypothetical protein
MKCSAVVVCLAATVLSLVASASQAMAATTVGQVAPATPPSPTCSGGPVDLVQPTVSSGTPYVVPGDIASPVVTSWTTNAAPGAGQALTFKVFRATGATRTFLQVAHDGPRPVASGTMSSFPVDIPVKAGDVLGLNSNGANTCLFPATDSNELRMGNLADGENDAFLLTEADRLNVSAVVKPSNVITLGGLVRNKKKGTAILNVAVPGPGTLAVSGNGVKAINKSVSAGAAKLLIKATGKRRKRLNQTGKVRLKVAITYSPTGGDPSTQSTKLKLKKL